MKATQSCAVLLIGIALMLTPAVGRGDAGDQPIEKPKAETFVGAIRTLDLDKRVITVEMAPISKTFGIASDCEVITKDKPKGSLEDLAVGSIVNVTYLDANGALIAHRIEQKTPPQQTMALTSIVRRWSSRLTERILEYSHQFHQDTL
ncbi:MAG TPA: hypothetical protein VLZ30_10235 [Verrucomicrobiae bacterium]|nr:hypothetical protein [Verrucomicrobiae bacterium]